MERFKWTSSIWFILCYVVCVGLTSANHFYSLPLCFIAFLCSSILWFKLFKNRIVNAQLYLSLPFAVIMLIVILLPDSLTVYSILYALGSTLAPVAASMILDKRYLSSGMITSFFLLSCVYAEPNFTLLLSNANQDVIQLQSEYQRVKLFHKDGRQFIQNDDELIVLDFWHMRCGACFKKFPHFENLSKSFKDSSIPIKFYTVNVPLSHEVPDSSITFFESLNYDLTPLYIQSREEIQEIFEFNTYPHYAVLSSDSILFSGKFDFSELILFGKPEDILEDLINSKGGGAANS